jgi:hypothetical protein
MKHGIFRFLIACLTASLTMFTAFPAGAVDQDAPVICLCPATFKTAAVQSLTLVDNGRFLMGFAFSSGFSADRIEWGGNWQQKGARLCLTPDPPAFVLYAHPAEGCPAGELDDMTLVALGKEERKHAAFAWSPSGELPEPFLKMDLNEVFLPLHAQDGYLFVAHMPETGDVPLDIQRYSISLKQRYRLHYADLPRTHDDLSYEGDSRPLQDSLFLMPFAEFKEMPEVFFASMSGDEGSSEKLRAAIEKHARGRRPIAGRSIRSA